MQKLIDALMVTGLPRHVMLMVGDRDGRILYVSPRLCEVLGYSAEELTGQGFRSLKSGLHDDAFYAGMWSAVARGEEWHHEIANRCKDGSTVWLEMTLFALDGAEQRYLGVCSNVTERKRAEQAHRQVEDLLAQTLQGDPVPTFVIDATHRVTHWNRALEALTGVRAADVANSGQAARIFYGEVRPVMADMIVDGSIERLEAFYGTTLRRSPVVTDAYEAEGYFPDIGGGGRWLAFTAAPLRDAAGRIIGAIETLQDVTERKQAEAALKHAYDELEMLVQQRTGELARAKAALEADMQERERSERELLRRNAELTELNTRLGEAQEQLAQSERLASIGQLAAGVAHEINNPIGYVQSNLGTLGSYLDDLFQLMSSYELALAEMPRDNPQLIAAMQLKQEKDFDFLREDVPSLMAESHEGITRVRKIVADLKDFSRVDNSQEWQWANLHQGLESTLNIVNNEIKYKADVVKQFGDLPDIECLPSQLNQVFMNLMVNAAHAIPVNTRGTITLRTGMGEGGDTVWVEVADTGCGIEADHLKRIFDPFFTTKPVGKGTGLGLSLSYGIVQKHGGQIMVSSEPGKGSRFRVSLPVSQTHGEEHDRTEGLQ
ncbi:MAG: PAS domain S-box protein [Rhodocyclaceae bacterium]|jgi:PAS domain S-box-containing protein|nr:PAS domain S-box protein [Rhodocyclaceae bacterium]